MGNAANELFRSRIGRVDILSWLMKTFPTMTKQTRMGMGLI